MKLEFSAAAAEWPSLVELRAIAPNKLFPAASLAKLLVAVGLIELHPEALIERTKIKVGRSAIEDGLSGGIALRNYHEQSVRDLLTGMVSQSDNVAANALIDYLGLDALKAMTRRIGIRHMRLHGHFFGSSTLAAPKVFTTARECNQVLGYILRQARSNDSQKASGFGLLISIMSRQEDRRFLRDVVPSSVMVADKTGELDGELNETGIVDPEGTRPLLISVLCRGPFDVEDPLSYGYAVKAMRSETATIYGQAIRLL